MVVSHKSDPDYRRLLHEQKERLKELACINQTTAILKEGKSIDETLQQIVLLFPAAWQYPEFTSACIRLADKEYVTPGFRETKWKLFQEFTTIDNEKGSIEVCYTREFAEFDEGPFLKEERNLIMILGSLINGFINSYKASHLIPGSLPEKSQKVEERDETSRKLLQKFLDRHNAERDVFHDLMPFTVKEILLVANLYDAYTIEGEGRFSDHILGEYYQNNYSSIPRVTGVTGEEEAFYRLSSRHYDMIIIMVGVDKENPMHLCSRIRERYPYVPVFMLLNNKGDIEFVKKQKDLGVPFDNYFVWTGESKVFFAMVALLEDKVNLENDTKKGLTRIILLVEDSSEYYSVYLPMLYTLVMEQTKNLIEDVSTDEIYKVLKLRARPKVILAVNYEEAIEVLNLYKESLLCVISDISFPKDNILDEKAGIELIRHAKNEVPGLPAVLQSSDPENAKYAHILKSNFINKNSESLFQDLKSFINYYLGFGHFVYRDNQGRQIAVAKSIKEFESFLETVPEDSLFYHAMKNHFSLWLMARGEVRIAKIIYPLKVSDFSSLKEMRNYLLDIIRKRRKEMNKGRVINFEASVVNDETNVVSLADGSLGGKGRGLAFLNTLIYSFDLGRLLPGISIKTPVTSVIGTDEFDQFMDRNHLWDKVKKEKDYSRLQQFFIEGNLSYNLEKRLRIFLKMINKPLAVRSSSLLEDSMNQPFSGIFGTYLLPNNHPDAEVRLRHLSDAVKLVFSSIYSKNARAYFEATGFKTELEKMAVVIQEVVGNRFGDTFYPHISGVAQSYNFYPVAHMTPQDGFAVLAAGLGQYIVEGGKAFRFSPSYPSIDVISQRDICKYSQVSFYAVDMGKKDLNLLEGENAGLVTLGINEAEIHGTLKHMASVYNTDNDTIIPGLDSPGPRVVNFADILKYDYIPLSSSLKTILEVVKEAFGAPVELEFAVDLSKDTAGNASLYLLQVKPLVGSGAIYNIDPGNLVKDDLIIFSTKSMGNGMIEDISDVIFVEPDKFDNRMTDKMAEEIDRMNEGMLRENKRYILIGPGRWGTRDKFIGVPVVWPQISNAKVIVEISLPGFPLDASLGSHFFHNVTSRNVGYFSLPHTSGESFVSWDTLFQQETVDSGVFFRHVRFRRPVFVGMDGKKSISIVSKNKPQT
jgi:DNA-binding NarL/FixJ family response regulator